MKITQSRYLNIFFSLVMLLILVIAYVSYFQINKFLISNNWVIHTHRVLDSTNSILIDILDAESITSGYIISGDISLVENFNSKLNKILVNFTQVKKLTIENQNQQIMLEELQPLLKNKIAYLQKIVEFKKTHKLQASEMKKFVHDGQDDTYQIKLLLKQLYESEISLLQSREVESIQNFNSTVYLTSFATIVSVFFLVFILTIFNRLLKNLEKSNSKIETSFLELENQSHEMLLINDMNNLLSSSASINESLGIISLYLKRLLPFSAGIVYLMKSSANYLEPIAEWNQPKIKEKNFLPNQCWALRQGKIHIYCDSSEDVACEHNIINHNSPAYICTPMLAQNEIIGVLYLEIQPSGTETKNEIKERIQQKALMIQNLAGQIALSISSMKLHDVLKTRSTRDSLTNLYNRSYLTETLERDLHRAKRKNISVAIVMMDLDLFKNVNDTYGHEAGDIILKRLAKLMTDNIRGSDIACRYGGEEFLIVFYDALLENAIMRTEQLRKAISDLQFHFEGTMYSVTASFGIAMYPEHNDENAERLIKAADEALYESKHNGRNKVTVYKKPA